MRVPPVTEAEWNIYADPQGMLEFLWCSGKLSDRKARLFAVAVCRRIWHALKDERSRRVVEVAERYADRLAVRGEVHSARAEALAAVRGVLKCSATVASMRATRAAYGCLKSDFGASLQTAQEVASDAAGASDERSPEDWDVAVRTEANAQVPLVRCLFGNPFRTLIVDQTWLTWNNGNVQKLARAAYEERELPLGTLDTTRLGILADALEEAGCDDEHLLAHLRGPCPHARGCFVVDALLGKS
jgi:hypothetical protein